ncbi:energy transducer TonB [Neiella marina]|uniref:Energy transducer TonB n=1 Tax=Neiella holothuriorum TaxID=2870530 RepID=A0ABS7EJY9_9GAMM|nr:energy transducer TonB [Neiella holothuriorum]MBW8191977.1 energy transducer TonB [Neiella holothuriorum]
MKYQILKLISILPIVIVTSANANYADVKLTHINPEKSAAQWIRTKQFSPQYPIELAMKGIVGCGVFKVTVDENGKTGDVELVSSIPKKVIYKPAKKVIKSWEWKNVSDEPNLAEEKVIRLDFCMGGKTEVEAKARCAEQAKLECSA